MEIGVGSAKSGLFDAEFVAGVAQMNGRRVFEADALVLERDAGKGGFDGDGFGVGESAADLKTALHAAMAGVRLEMKRPLYGRLVVGFFDSDVAGQSIIACQAQCDFSRELS